MQEISQLNKSPLDTGDIAFGIILLSIGLLTILWGIILFNPKIGFLPKVSVDENAILIREEVFMKTRQVNWKDIKEITFKSFELDTLRTDNSNELIMLKTNAQTSFEVKKLLREIADRKSVMIVGR